MIDRRLSTRLLVVAGGVSLGCSGSGPQAAQHTYVRDFLDLPGRC